MNWQRKESDYFVYMLAFEDVTTLYIVKRINALSLSLSLSLNLSLSLSLSLLFLLILLCPLLYYNFILFTSHSFSDNVHLNI